MSFLPPFNITQDKPPKRTPNASTHPNFPINPNPSHLNDAPPQNNVFAQPHPNAPSPHPAPLPPHTTQPYPPASFNPPLPGSRPLYTQFAADPASARPVPRLQPFSASTQEILKSIGTPQNVSAGTPEWEAARERVLKSMAQSGEQAISPAATEFRVPVKRGRGRGRPPRAAGAGVNGVGARDGGAATATAIGAVAVPDGAAEVSTPIRRGRGGRPRGSRSALGSGRGRGGKRKRGDSEDRDDAISLSPTASPEDLSNVPLTPAEPTITKSGRSITKPSPYTPLPPSTASSSSTRGRTTTANPRGRRKGNHLSKTHPRDPAQALCTKCLRGHSPASNVIVFCDACNTPYHQWCHSPHIGREVVEVAEKEWFCGVCEAEREEVRLPMSARAGAGVQGLSEAERRTYLEGLPVGVLVELLVVATGADAELRAFAPDTRGLLRDPTAGTLASSHDRGHDRANPHAAIGGVDSGNGNNGHDKAPEDPYPDITASASTNDPPSTYPRPGAGPIRPRPTTEPEDLHWLLEDEADAGPDNDGAVGGFGAFSHYYDGGGGGGDGVGVDGEGGEIKEGGEGGGTGADLSGLIPVTVPVTMNSDGEAGKTKGAWIRRFEGGSGTGTDSGMDSGTTIGMNNLYGESHAGLAVQP